MTELDDHLLRRVRRGDSEAFESLFLRHYGAVYRVVYGLVRGHEWADDLAQKTFLKLYRKPPRSTEGSTLMPWLCQVALNRGYNALRGEGRERQRLERVDHNSNSSHPDPAIEVLRAEENSHVREVLASLPERQGKLLLLRYAGLSYVECAAVLDVAPGSIGTLLARAERAFREAYAEVEPLAQSDALERTAK